MKTTRYFDHMRTRSDRASIKDTWIESVIRHPEREEIQGEMIHNAFFDRRFKGGGLRFSDRITPLRESCPIPIRSAADFYIAIDPFLLGRLARAGYRSHLLSSYFLAN